MVTTTRTPATTASSTHTRLLPSGGCFFSEGLRLGVSGLLSLSILKNGSLSATSLRRRNHSEGQWLLAETIVSGRGRPNVRRERWDTSEIGCPSPVADRRASN